MPEILDPDTQKSLEKRIGQRKRGEVKQFKGAFGEPIFIRKTKGDLSPAKREVIEKIRSRDAEKLIDRIKRLRLTKKA